MKESLKWGLIGLGSISHQFANDLALVPSATLQSVGSRNISKANEFAGKYGANNAHGSYAALLTDPDVDIVYIGTPHDSHADLVIQALECGKHVLCEKPLAVNTAQVNRIIDAQRAHERFVMEAFWSRFIPAIQKAISIVKSGSIGHVRFVDVNFSIAKMQEPSDSRLFNLDLAGGSILDVGVYPVFLAYMLLGKPKTITAKAIKHETGADAQTLAIFEYEDATASIMSGFMTWTDNVAKIYGETGAILLDAMWHMTEGFTIINGDTRHHVSAPKKGKGFVHEIEECHQCISKGRMQSELWSLGDSLNLIEITDEMRRQIDLKYPFEN